jgi:ATP-dependent helicase/DNAse subunit B
LTNVKYTCILLNMAILPSIDNNTRKRELTDKQQAFLTHLVETQGDAKEAAKLAGYSSHYHHVVKTLKSEILELTQEVLANSAPKAAFKLVEIMESNRPIIQANNKLAAAQTLLDRVGVGKIDRVDVNHNVNSGGIFLMPDKKPLDLEEGDYEDISD